MNAVTREEQGAMQLAPMSATSTASLVLDVASMDSIMRLSEIMAKSRTTIPDHLKGNSADCAAVIMQAMQWQMNPYAVAQKTHVVNGTLGYEGQLVNAAITSSGVTRDRFNYEWFGAWEKIIGKTKVVNVPEKGKKGDKDYKKGYQFHTADYDLKDEEGLGIRIWATLRGESQPRELTLLLVQASVRNSPLWATDPRQQLAYLAVKRWSRLYAPDVILGVYTPDELEQDYREPLDITPSPTTGTAGAQDLLPECSEDQFKAETPKWRQIIVQKKKTPEALIAQLSTRATFTEDQKLTIHSWAHEND